MREQGRVGKILHLRKEIQLRREYTSRGGGRKRHFVGGGGGGGVGGGGWGGLCGFGGWGGVLGGVGGVWGVFWGGFWWLGLLGFVGSFLSRSGERREISAIKTKASHAEGKRLSVKNLRLVFTKDLYGAEETKVFFPQGASEKKRPKKALFNQVKRSKQLQSLDC